MTPPGRYRDACVPDVQAQFRALSPRPTRYEFWYQTDELISPFFAPNLTANNLFQMDRCHIQGAYRLRADGYIAFNANSQDQPYGERNRKWKLNNCRSVTTADGGGAHLFVAKLAQQPDPSGDNGDHAPDTGRFVRSKSDRIVANVVLNTNRGKQPPDVGNLIELYHTGGIDGVGDFLYVGIDAKPHVSYLKILDMADPENPRVVGGRGFAEHRAQAIGVTDDDSGRILLAVVDTNRSTPLIFFYAEKSAAVTGGIERHRFEKIGTWRQTQGADETEAEPFPFLSYQGISLIRECGTNRTYFVGIHNERSVVCGGRALLPGMASATRLDLYRFQLAASSGPDAAVQVEAVLRRSLRDVRGEACAGASVFISPRGQAMVYTMEHDGRRALRFGKYPNGLLRWVGGVRFYEYGAGASGEVSNDDGDTVAGVFDICPDDAEDLDGYKDEDGCPDEDNDGDGVVDAEDRCVKLAEDADGINDGDGCPDTGLETALSERIALGVHRLFPDDRQIDRNEADALLRPVVAWWQEQDAGALCVEAHTNRYGDPAGEHAETVRWATETVAALVRLNVPVERLSARAMGSKRPLVPPSHPDAGKRNVRVEFVVCSNPETPA